MRIFWIFSSFLYFSLKIDHSCYSDSVEQNLNSDIVNQQLIFHCSCPGCTMFVILTVVFIVCVLSIGVLTIFLRTRPTVEAKNDSKYEGILETSFWIIKLEEFISFIDDYIVKDKSGIMSECFFVLDKKIIMSINFILLPPKEILQCPMSIGERSKQVV